MSPASTEIMTSSVDLKNEGNEAFKMGDLEKALDLYEKAANATKSEDFKDLAIIYKNRAAVHLKMENYTYAVEDCTKSLQLVPDDPKALFRRCQAHDALGNPDKAYTDARDVHR